MDRIAAEAILAEFLKFDALNRGLGEILADNDLAAPMKAFGVVGRNSSRQFDVTANQADLGAFVDTVVLADAVGERRQ